MVHKLEKSDYKQAMEGEGWAIVDYQDMITRATGKEKETLTHIMNEEKEHLDELMKLIKCKVR